MAVTSKEAQNPAYWSPIKRSIMPQSVEDILAKAKTVSQQAEQKFPSTNAATATGKSVVAKPSYAMVPPARKEAAGLPEELKAKGEMVQKGREALK